MTDHLHLDELREILKRMCGEDDTGESPDDSGADTDTVDDDDFIRTFVRRMEDGR